MAMFWSDKTFWNRVKFGNKSFLSIDIPLYVVSLIVWSFFIFNDISFLALLILAIPTYMVLYGFIDIFLQLPHYRIPDTYSKEVKTFLYIVNFLIACFLFYFVSVGLLQHYYPQLQKFICCDALKSFPKI
jgi:hypothetical protein